MVAMVELLELWQAPHANPANKAAALVAWAELHQLTQASFEERYVFDVMQILVTALAESDEQTQLMQLHEVHRSLMENPQYFPAELRALLLHETTPRVQQQLVDDGHLSVDGVRQKTVQYKPTELAVTTAEDSALVQQFINDLQVSAGLELVLEPDVEVPQLHTQTAVSRVESAGNHVIIHFPDGTMVPRDPVLDGLGVWHLFPHQAAWPTIESTVREPAARSAAAHPVEAQVRSVDVFLPGNVPVTVSVGKNGLAELKVTGTITIKADKARQLLLGEPHYPARLPTTKQDQFDQLASQLALGVWAYEAVVAGHLAHTAAGQALQATLAKAGQRLADLAGAPVERVFAGEVLKKLGFS